MIRNLRQRFGGPLVVSVSLALMTAVLNAQTCSLENGNISQSLDELGHCISFQLWPSNTDYDEVGGHGEVLVYLNPSAGCSSTINNYNIVVNVYNFHTLDLVATAARYNLTSEVGTDWQWYTSNLAADLYITYQIYGNTTAGSDYSFSGSLGTQSCS